LIKALITGATGFVGRHLTTFLKVRTDWQVYGIDMSVSAGSGTGQLVDTYVQLDLQEQERVAEAVSELEPDLIFHLAAQSAVPDSVDRPNETLTNNIAGQVNLLEAALKSKRRPRILIIGSSDEYGLVSPDDLPVAEDAPFRPISPYGVSKIAQDMLGLQYYLRYGMNVIRVRPFNHIGPGQSDKFVLSSFARQIAVAEVGRADPILHVGNLDVGRDFTDVRDVVRAYHLAISKGQAGEVYNVGTGRGVLVGEALSILLGLSYVKVDVIREDSRVRSTDVPMIVCDGSKFSRLTGWRPEISLERTLAEVLDYWRIELAGNRFAV
jgi:GDP-4-dehydro-6-deoxy-D-mannose reductase